MDEVGKRLEPTIRNDISRAAREAVSAKQRPSIGETIGKIGESAVRLLPLAKISVKRGPTGIEVEGNPFVIPVFFLLAARDVWEFITARLQDRAADCQLAISSRLALLGHRVGGEYEREVRLRLTNLHTWQERSIREAANLLAVERVS